MINPFISSNSILSSEISELELVATNTPSNNNEADTIEFLRLDIEPERLNVAVSTSTSSLSDLTS
jgi:hypothetical protein